MRRKGEKRITPEWPASALDIICKMIADGDSWMRAWYVQAATPFPIMERKGKIAASRLMAIELGAPATIEEVETLAAVWRVNVKKVLATMPAGTLSGDPNGSGEEH